MNTRNTDFKIVIEKAIELLQDKKAIQKELEENNIATCRVNTETYTLEINIKENSK